MTPWREKGQKKAEWLTEEVAKAVNTGKSWACETVDFNDPNRPPTCIEVDFPILPINQIAIIEGNAGKPIYQMSKWWARRRSSVFRAMLLASAIKAPNDPSEAAKRVWDTYYGNHQKKGAFNHLKVADPFMGGGTTLVEGSRLGMQMYGNDLNPVAWFITKNELAQIDKSEVEALLAEIECEVKPQIMPFYSCNCPRGHKGKWVQLSTGKIMGDDFNPVDLSPDERKGYRYEGPEIIYVFWVKHGPCQMTGCGHRTPMITSPVISVKKLTVKTWDHKCPECHERYDIEEKDARMAPGIPLVVTETERPFSVMDENKGVTCPFCGHYETGALLDKRTDKSMRKKVVLSLLVHPRWLEGECGTEPDGKAYGGSVTDTPETTAAWNRLRADRMGMLEVRGMLPDEVTCTETGVIIKTGKEGGNVPRQSHFACGSCGAVQNILTAVKASGKTGPVAAYAIQGYCPECAKEKQAYNGRFFKPVKDSSAFDKAFYEWDKRKSSDLKKFWPKEQLYPYEKGNDSKLYIQPDHGFTHWWTMFNPRQLLVHSQLLQAIAKVREKNYEWKTREYVLGAFQQYLRNQNMFCFWNPQRDTPEPLFSNNNFHPKSTVIENAVFSNYGRGNWLSCSNSIVNVLDWYNDPWDLVSNESLCQQKPSLANDLSGKSEKTHPGDAVRNNATLNCISSTDLTNVQDESYDLVITDPPFGSLIHYSDLSDFFYVWLRLLLKERYPDYSSAENTPKSIEVISNKGLHGKEADSFYQRLLTACWREAHRILKPGGMLSFTFHHSEDAPWVAVLESLFDAGFYLAVTYPIRSDETKGTGEFGSKKIEFDIIHVCRKHREKPKPVSWAKLRREVLQDVRQLETILKKHGKQGLPEADLQVIRRGKALEYFSRHYGKVYKDQDSPITVLEALVGINQLLDEETGGPKKLPPHNAEPFTRMLLRLFDGKGELPRDQIQKFLRGTGSAPSDYVARGWLYEEKKVFYLTSSVDIAQAWIGKHRKSMISDYDQSMFLIGACFENSGIKATETLSNPNFRPHPALGAILTWQKTHGATTQIRNAATLASQLYRNWEAKNQTKVEQLKLFDHLGEEYH